MAIAIPLLKKDKVLVFNYESGELVVKSREELLEPSETDVTLIHKMPGDDDGGYF